MDAACSCGAAACSCGGISGGVSGGACGSAGGVSGGAAAAAWGRRVAAAAVVVLALVVAAAVGRRLVRGSGRYAIGRTREVVSRVDGMRYRVHEGHAGPQKAADTLAALNGRVIDLMRHLRARYLRAGAGGKAGAERRKAAQRLLARYNPDNLAENSPKDPGGDTSYTLDKGAVVALCLRERDPAASGDPRVNDLHDLDTLTFVTLHEMAHIAIEDVDHPPRFWAAFRFLLEAAEEAGVYASPDYAADPRTYCGVKIDYNPRYDAATASF
jgi:hypothetical protein